MQKVVRCSLANALSRVRWSPLAYAVGVAVSLRDRVRPHWTDVFVLRVVSKTLCALTCVPSWRPRMLLMLALVGESATLLLSSMAS